MTVVVLLGWLGSKTRHLSKYCQLATKCGCKTLPYEAPPPAKLLLGIKLEQHAENILEDLKNSGAEEHGWVMQSFSNGGAFVWEKMASLMYEEKPEEYGELAAALRGKIFDSCPAYLHAASLQTALHETFGRSWWKSALPRALAALLTLPGQAAAALRLRAPPGEAFWARLIALPSARPELYLYSDDDPMVDPAQLARLIAARRARGAEVAARRWEHSRHCAHLLVHGEEYEAVVVDFLRAAAAAAAAPPGPAA
mmetsp:Transcript_36126/g.56488  ORF Transcript_36126/g.56488 Transcript_36126/m.56488 type:complete len:254 (+) Transcript_36126:163-924(+)